MNNYQRAYMDESSNQSKTLKYNNYYNLNRISLWMMCNYMHAHVCTFVHMHACSCYTSMYACMLVACFYKMFPHTENYSLFQNNKTRSQ